LGVEGATKEKRKAAALNITALSVGKVVTEFRAAYREPGFAHQWQLEPACMLCIYMCIALSG
jgi:hypothetical protein